MNPVPILIVAGFLLYKAGYYVGWGKAIEVVEQLGIEPIEDADAFLQDQRENAELGLQ